MSKTKMGRQHQLNTELFIGISTYFQKQLWPSSRSSSVLIIIIGPDLSEYLPLFNVQASSQSWLDRASSKIYLRLKRKGKLLINPISLFNCQMYKAHYLMSHLSKNWIHLLYRQLVNQQSIICWKFKTLSQVLLILW